MNATDANPGLPELVQDLIRTGCRFELVPTGRADDGITRQVYYAVRVILDRMTAAQLTQLLAIVDGSPYDGRMSSGVLVLETPRP